MPLHIEPPKVDNSPSWTCGVCRQAVTGTQYVIRGLVVCRPCADWHSPAIDELRKRIAALESRVEYLEGEHE